MYFQLLKDEACISVNDVNAGVIGWRVVKWGAWCKNGPDGRANQWRLLTILVNDVVSSGNWRSSSKWRIRVIPNRGTVPEATWSTCWWRRFTGGVTAVFSVCCLPLSSRELRLAFDGRCHLWTHLWKLPVPPHDGRNLQLPLLRQISNSHNCHYGWCYAHKGADLLDFLSPKARLKVLLRKCADKSGLDKECLWLCSSTDVLYLDLLNG